ncbi:hypothetical protein BH23BAC4_BH23BAC4_00080 [soil metagenome]
MTPAELQKRTFDFALAVIQFCGTLRRDEPHRIISRQLMRAATSVGANYRAVCRARSKREFIAKLGIVEEEADESSYWLEMLLALGDCEPARCKALLAESGEIVAIISASRRTARAQS